MPVKAPRPVAAPPPVYNWTGFYVGGHVGYLWGRTHVEEDGVVTEDGVPTNGVVGGALAGYNWQYNQFFLASKASSVGPTRTALASLRHHQ
jgi:outer membrane immunogenic protein